MGFIRSTLFHILSTVSKRRSPRQIILSQLQKKKEHRLLFGSILVFVLSCSEKTLKTTADHMITPSMRMSFNPSSLTSVTQDGYFGTYDVRDRTLASPDTILQSIQKPAVNNGIFSFFPFSFFIILSFLLGQFYPAGVAVQGQLSVRNLVVFLTI